MYPFIATNKPLILQILEVRVYRNSLIAPQNPSIPDCAHALVLRSKCVKVPPSGPVVGSNVVKIPYDIVHRERANHPACWFSVIVGVQKPHDFVGNVGGVWSSAGSWLPQAPGFQNEIERAS
jgi:hypothetical protein